ncbi:unnamed protein product [Protopolystoma xenopodis]|uniref:Uncharacterized protein n=1 Tax=Protopolystoma xenopodis TaxID=117903 RepID=A0A3S5B9V5_9PLAT|nr:unnamed protein product [Protopolystoma xenopodis]
MPVSAQSELRKGPVSSKAKQAFRAEPPIPAPQTRVSWAPQRRSSTATRRTDQQHPGFWPKLAPTKPKDDLFATMADELTSDPYPLCRRPTNQISVGRARVRLDVAESVGKSVILEASYNPTHFAALGGWMDWIRKLALP